jgi:site-specific DNA-methyltransferase (adenine-specific)
MEAMKEMPDKAYELAIVDPPYGIESHEGIGLGDKGSGRNNRKISKWIGGKWDCATPPPEYFDDLFRVSKNQIICGGNYFNLPPSRCFLVWDKVQRVDQADAELMWTSFNKSVRVFQYSGQKLRGFMNPHRFHPTEKPVPLYQWLLKNYAKPGDRILDTHGGSMSIAIACDIMGYDLDLYEIDKDFFEAGKARLELHQRQGVLSL